MAAIPAPTRRPRVVLGLVALVVLALWLANESAPWWRPFWQVMTAPAPRHLAVPVAGVRPAMLVDTWGAPRGEGRSHRGIDIFARRGTPVVTPVPGIVIGIGQDRLGGNVVRVLGPGRQVHYFAHLEAFADIAPRQWLRPGDIVGFVGDTGNARGTPPHLHYGLYAFGGAINPFPLLRARPVETP
jgi:murein DD-endopeptidase MepM/ murein hydrolase activator NlpD